MQNPQHLLLISRGIASVQMCSLPFVDSGSLRVSLLLAAFATLLRPTNLLIWLPLAAVLMWRLSNSQRIRASVEALVCG